MTWNHRVMRRIRPKATKGEQVQFGIYEVYYERKKVIGWTRDEMSPRGDDLNELKESFKQMDQAFNAPVLDYKTGKEIKEECK